MLEFGNKQAPDKFTWRVETQPSQFSLSWSTGGQGSPAIMSLRTHSLEQVVSLT